MPRGGSRLPGTMIGTVAMLDGCRAGWFVCGRVCFIAMITPPMIILSLITYFYTIFKENVWVMSAMTGVRAAIVPIIASAVTVVVLLCRLAVGGKKWDQADNENVGYKDYRTRKREEEERKRQENEQNK